VHCHGAKVPTMLPTSFANLMNLKAGVFVARNRFGANFGAPLLGCQISYQFLTKYCGLTKNI
jgi:hypothetical protein